MKKFYNLEACSGSKLFDTLMIFLNKYFVKKKLKKTTTQRMHWVTVCKKLIDGIYFRLLTQEEKRERSQP